MANVTTKQFADSIQDLLTNPARAHLFALAMLEEVTDGKYALVDPTNPFAFLLESSTAVASAGLNKTETIIRRLYPTLAQNYDDLYYHMSDVDYLDRFATPARTNMVMFLGLEEVKQKAVLENNSGVRRLTIPRYTKFTVADTTFTSLYPIDIRVMMHGGFRITFDDDILTDVDTLTTNLVDWTIVSMNGSNWLKITVPTMQLNISRVTAQINRTSGYSKVHSITDNFYYCEAYNYTNNNWVKMNVTHNELIHDPLTPTVVLNVLDNAVKVSIPHIYTNNNLVNDTIRIDFYTTKGKIDLNLSGYNSTSFEANWNPLIGNNLDVYSAPLNTFNELIIFSPDNVSGGNFGLSFEELRKRVINRTTISEGLPITNKQLASRLNNLGFNLVTNIDDITNRQFLATRMLPPPTNNQTVSSMGASMQTLISSFSSLSTNPLVLTGYDRITLQPEMLYALVNGKLSVVSEQERQRLLSLSNKDLIDELGQTNLLFTPYYYVLNKAHTSLDCRIYDFKHPNVNSRYFFQQNLSIEPMFDILNYSIYPATDKTGFYLEVEAMLGSTLKNTLASNLNIQLSFQAADTSTRYHLDGKLISAVGEDGVISADRYIWQFLIGTNFDVNENDKLISMPNFAPMNLIQEFDVTTVIRNIIPETYVPSELDDIIKDAYLHHGQWVAITQEKINVKLGERLERLYNRTRTVVDGDSMLVRESDEYMRYEKDVYKRDATGTIAFTYNSQTQDITLTKLHSAGDIVFNEKNEPIYKWRKGDIVLDTFGNPMYKDNGLGLKREIDLFLLDAKYYFANSATTLEYKDSVIKQINTWVNDDMVKLNNQLLERSEMFFHPIITKGNITVRADNNKMININSQQSFTITCFMNEFKYSDASLRDSITTTLIVTLYECLQYSTVSKDFILARLRAATSEDVISLTVDGFLNDDWSTVTLLDQAQRLSFAKRLVSKVNGNIEVEDDVVVRYAIHSM